MALGGAKLTLSSKVGFVLQIVLAGKPATPGFQIEITTQTNYLNIHGNEIMKYTGRQISPVTQNGITNREGSYLLLSSKHAFDKPPRILSTLFSDTHTNTQPSSIKSIDWQVRRSEDRINERSSDMNR